MQHGRNHDERGPKMSKRTVRVTLDVMLSIMIVFEMFIQFTGDFLHEVVGAAFFITIAVHLGLSAKWMKSTAKAAQRGKMTPRRTALAVMGCLLALTTLVLAVSSIAISNVLMNAGFTWPIGSYAMWVIVHTVSSYALCALTAIHLAMHWAFLANAFKVPYNPERRQAISTGVYAVAALGTIALGVTAAREVMPQTALPGSTDQAGSEATASNGNNSAESSSSSSSTAQTGSTSQKNGSGKHGNRSGSNQGGTNSTPNANSGSDTNSSNGSGANSSNGTSTNSSNGSDDSGTSGATTDVSGICTLCRKQCPLSAPKCNKPYQAGLI